MNIICVKFGPKYGAEFVNKIYKDLNQPTDFYCYTDDATGLHKGVNVIPDMGRPTLKKWWNKLRLFDKNFPLSGGTLFLDLDVQVHDPKRIFQIPTENLTFINCHWKQGKLYNRLSNYDVKMNSSMIAWNADDPEIHKIWDHFNTGLRDYYLRKYVGIDRFIVHEDIVYDTFPNTWIQSKKHHPDINYQPIVTTFEEIEIELKDLI